MIFGRPTSLWLGAATAAINLLALVAGAFGLTITVEQLAAINAAVAALIVLIANQPPVVAPGAPVVVQTAAGQPNVTINAPTAEELTPPPTS